ncbi:TraR/DksA C4-type zinc finger protein [Kamptonema cortianum]|nr:TraR/DksA C4-type zinc finger protein [Oscillatoria laete-virens]MDK3160295.1 TraR/DksA C4-type zinc finger protein [Kamptonema cortianum]MDL5053678.1 TraR/DksA C4-type zinc finger protein [Oscillatoria laete-virens NRMC-F 0139]
MGKDKKKNKDKKSAKPKAAAKAKPAKKPAAKKPVAKTAKVKAPAKAAKPAPAAKKVPAKKAAVAKPSSPISSRKDIKPRSPVKPSTDAPVELINKKTSYGDAFLKQQKAKLLELRDALLDQIHDTAQNSVRDAHIESSGLGMHQGDAGSDTYDRDFALTVLSQEQDALYEIEEAIKRVEDKTYGVCQMSGKQIPQLRLEAIPFTRFTVECQAQLEKENRGRQRWSSETPFAEMMGRGDDEDDNYEKDE